MLNMNIRKYHKPLRLFYRNISALYLTGDKAKESYAVLTPHFDFKNKLDDPIKLLENLKNRKININFEEFYDKWNLYRELEIMKQILEQKRHEIAENLKKLDSKNDENMIRKIKENGKILREDLKLLKGKSYELEDKFIHEFLNLPNELHQNTPTNQEKVIYSYLDKIEITNSKFHLDYKDFIVYSNPTMYYLKNEAAQFDLYSPFNCIDYFTQKNNFIHFSNPDFVRSIIPEAAGIDPKNLFLIKEDHPHDKNSINYLHLTGGGSIYSFIGYIAKLSIFPNILPLRLICNGKQYNTSDDNNHKGLYTVNQASCIQGFIIANSEESAQIEFDQFLNQTIHYLEKFNHHFRVVYVTPDKLTIAESLRASIQMYSTYFNEYIEIASISHYGDFISKRILFNVKNGKSYHFPHIISGTILNIPKLIGIFLENYNNFELPKFLENVYIEKQ